MNIIKKISSFIIILCAVCISSNLSAQEIVLQLTGTVVNGYGEPLQNVLVLSENGKNSFLTGSDGTYTISSVGDASRFVTLSAAGYKNRRINLSDLVEGGEVTLEHDPHYTGGYVDMGYFTQSRESLTGAVSTVTGAELDKAPVGILTETLSGRLPGLTILQNLADFDFSGYGNNTSLIRGITSVNGYKPTIIIDGIICPNQYFEFLSPKEIESVSVLKDASATALYGIQGSGGA
ncbi:MAG: TonB-dependent receptor plug domain-containing protein, partial [Bacteroidales bacterium]|nr:TonB-dependent receptor plug domain-containing protein [Bacteroidales bacterium]